MDRIRQVGIGGWAAMAAVLLAAGAIGFRILGEDEPEPAAIASGPQSISIEQLQARADAEPGNPAAWQELGFALFEAGRFTEAADAYDRATKVQPDSAVLWSSLGEARVMASRSDPLPQNALEAFRKAVSIDPADPRARYFLAVEKDLSDDHAGAITDWLALLEDTPPGAPWEADLKRTIEQVGAINSIRVEDRIAAALASRSPSQPAVQAVPGPSAEQLAAAASIPPSEQRAMAEGMVARLAARLERQPQDVEGWVMLMRSYRQLGRDGDAAASLRKAVSANPGARNELEAAAASLGVGR